MKKTMIIMSISATFILSVLTQSALAGGGAGAGSLVHSSELPSWEEDYFEWGSKVVPEMIRILGEDDEKYARVVKYLRGLVMTDIAKVKLASFHSREDFKKKVVAHMLIIDRMLQELKPNRPAGAAYTVVTPKKIQDTLKIMTTFCREKKLGYEFS